MWEAEDTNEKEDVGGVSIPDIEVAEADRVEYDCERITVSSEAERVVNESLRDRGLRSFII